MRFLLQASIPTPVANEHMKAGTFAGRIQSIMEDIRPEAAYFTEIDGVRTGLFIVDLPDASHIPAIAEPLFIGFNASVSFHPVMLVEDLMAAGPAIEAAAKKYG
ncbi:MAG TPA: hypothetical protein VNE17_12395 [Nitrolancea sp.]|nr:hypothetical protein [Nitrolancea sp.]